MRAFTLAPVILAVTLGATAAVAGSRVLTVDPRTEALPRPTTEADFRKYHGFMYDLSEYADRKDVDKIEDNLKHQFDIVENAGFSSKVLNFFHSIPIIASDTECLEHGPAIACYANIAPSRAARGSYGATVWDSEAHQWTNADLIDQAADSGLGLIKLRSTMTKYTDDPILLHEFLHAFHRRMLPDGFENLGIKAAFADAKSKSVFDKKQYTLLNQQEFFAVTASIFLAGKESMHEPKTRAVLKEKLPDYYKFLVGMFGFDPDPSLPDKPAEAAATPVASAAPAPSAPAAPPAPATN
jgi:hypothetical protein